jgi:hypothetical protein
MPACRRSPGAALAAVAAGLDDLGLPHGGTETRWPIADAAGATRKLAGLAWQGSP